MPSPRRPEISYEEFEEKIINTKLKKDNTQTNAVIEVLHRNPIYLIQGPSGTVKATVIVEIIQQFIQKKKDIKILVVSQSNTAVDNVLERLPEKTKFILLASENAVEKDKISSKIKDWINKTEKTAQENFDKKFPKIDKASATLFKHFQKKPTISFEEITTLRKNQDKSKNHYEKTFHQTQNIEQVQAVFDEKLGSEYINLQKIHANWLAFVRNVASKKQHQNISQVKHGSADIGLDIALAKSMNVFGSTCIHIESSKYSSINFKFDVMIMDESSKATNAEALLVPINMSKKIVLIGDHKQLPPVATREKIVKEGIREDVEDDGLDIDKIYGESMFERLITRFESENQCTNLFTMLDIQYLMPRQIGYLISKFIYDGKLKNPPLDKVPKYDDDKAHNFHLKTSFVSIDDEQVPNSIIVVSTSKLEEPFDNGNKFKRINNGNIEVIKNKLEQKNDTSSAEVGVIAAYRGQVESFQRLITKKSYENLDIDINTVDQFQDSEKDIIIYDVVRSSKGKSGIGFLDDYRRINVTFSRAKKLLMVVGDSDYVLNRVQPNPNSGNDSTAPEREDLHLVKIFKQLQEWGCIYSSFEEFLKHDE